MPALFTASRVDPITLPDGTYCYDIMGGRSSSFLNVVSLAPVYFTGAIVTLQPLLRGWQTFVEIRNYGYGYAWMLSKRWNITVEGGIGIYRTKDMQRDPTVSDRDVEYIRHARRWVLAPSRLEVAVCYLF